MTFLRSLKHDTVIFGDFNVDMLADSKSRKDYEKWLYAFDFKQQNVQPTSVTATSYTCLDEIIARFHTQTQTIPTTISDHFSVLGQIHLSTDGIKQKPSFRKPKDLRGIEGKNALKFLFLLNQKHKKIYTGGNHTIDSWMCWSLRSTNFHQVAKKELPGLQTTLKRLWRNEMFFSTNGYRIPVILTRKHKKERNLVTSVIRNAKTEANSNKLGKNPSTTTVYRTLKSQTRSNQLRDLQKKLHLLFKKRNIKRTLDQMVLAMKYSNAGRTGRRSFLQCVQWMPQG